MSSYVETEESSRHAYKLLKNFSFLYFFKVASRFKWRKRGLK